MTQIGITSASEQLLNEAANELILVPIDVFFLANVLRSTEGFEIQPPLETVVVHKFCNCGCPFVAVRAQVDIRMTRQHATKHFLRTDSPMVSPFRAKTTPDGPPVTTETA
jgi:hypothetical protein